MNEEKNMTIIGIGIDMIKINRFKKLIFLYGLRIINRILSFNEMKEYNHKKKEEYLAQRFSAKESLAKALGLSIFNKEFFKNCEILQNNQGKPRLIVLGKIKKILKNLQIKKFLLVLQILKNMYNPL
ncbi:holo-[acyl-carrier protein] synthase [Buchnera aphidicola (Cinara tujafilina)]|uniref:Holo-[acyl-carrier-protein] synthase n=1 Tax=Buchnera aphidicola (Cinara tujafilina) TaxID=261317 RepID=F7WZ96_9GAMM|nr:holo-ACP synthase [Buchnera aphidicola]AEH39751.1 holo-[acyl-carrier protein] synthase [Buchnera aphidicola (Cinara tujafilina)]